jgi:hypothetical protein
MISVKQKGNFNNITNFLANSKKTITESQLERYGQEGVAALKAATPVDSGLTANSWYYKIERNDGSVAVTFHNSNIQNGVPIAIILQYGHGTGNGGWVEGRDYINPAIRPVFDKMVKEVLK